ncbi:hypothetical protein [Pseudarthrobacter sp. H2]|uniref:hypothetical protein n=1 Tax=Pseudarthrobacter sp. H2 TaxID=3418415 RepID=UPI003CF5B3F3
MDIELLIIRDCPNSGPAGELFARALTLEGIDAELVTVREIITEDEAVAHSFRGSPTFSIGGKDLFPSTAAPVVTCRVYQEGERLSGQPSLVSLRQAIRAAT